MKNQLFNKKRLEESLFSIFSSPITNIYTTDVLNVFDLKELISEKYLDKTSKLRTIKDMKLNKEYKANNFHYVTFSGEFKTRKDSELIKHSNLICIDIDYLDNEVERIKEVLNSDVDHTIMTFVSPNGKGLKIVYPIDISTHSQEEWYKAYSFHISKLCNISIGKIDSSCSNVSRPCFICYDPNVFINPQIESGGYVFPIDIQTESSQISYESYEIYYFDHSKLDFSDRDKEDNFQVLVNITITKNGDYKSPREPWIQKLCCRCNLFGMSKEKCLEYVLKYFENHPESIRIDNPIDVKKCLVNPVEDTYKRYEGDFGKWECKNEEEKANTPHIPTEVYSKLPQFLKEMCHIFPRQREKDVFLISTLTVLSACFPSVYGLYDQQSLGTNLFTFVTAPASAGKSHIKWSRKLIFKINKELKEGSIRAIELYNEKKEDGNRKSDWNKPKKKSLLIPANNSSTGVLQSIADNDGIGLIFETEADTLSESLSKEWGNFSDFLRKAFHHEPVSYKRRVNNEEVEVEEPHFSLLLSGTPEQVRTLIPSPENGLFSRFCFYSFDIEPEWKDVFEEFAGINLERYFESKADTMLLYYHLVKNQEGTVFSLTEGQQALFNNRFTIWHNQLGKLVSKDLYATVRRLGVITFRIAMILTTIRASDERKISKCIVCSDDDFNSSIAITSVLIEHTVSVYQTLTAKDENVLKIKPLSFFRGLPNEFTRKEAMIIAETLDIKEKTAESYLSKFITKEVLSRVEHNRYIKLAS